MNQANPDWRERWKQEDAWTVRELAQLCCGWDPTSHEFPDRELYETALEAINRAVRTKVLPTIDTLAWPVTGAERMYDAVPAFRPAAVADWAARRFPSSFPYKSDAWGAKRDTEELDPRERTSLLTIIGVLAKMANIDLDEPTKSAGVIAAEARQRGIKISERTVATHLNRVADALERRDVSQ